MKYHQIRFVSFGIWFLGLFLTDFTSIVNTPLDGWTDVLQYIKIISIIHITFVLIFLFYLLFRHFTDIDADAPNWKMFFHSMFDLSIHLDVGTLIFASKFFKTNNSYNYKSLYVVEVFVVLDAIMTFFLTPFKRWRSAVDVIGILPTVILAHVSVYVKNFNYIFVFIPITVVLLCPLIFTVFTLSFSSRISKLSRKIIAFFDPSLLPNAMIVPTSVPQHDSLMENLSASTRSEAPAITERATTGDENDYFDFKSVPFAFAATFFIHFGCFCKEVHNNTMVVMAHYFLTLAMILINTRVVAFPAIILTNVVDTAVTFNSVWPELSFV
ncbi:hypothetical protein TVAG_101290 [Trichomonas vaginalis G3]|uniref:Uncharacterized protein n=1 Tax=Trichomonas vaginalis (strain ATCC PRA-98 / G3) TaxID=412133 RepID=A2DJL1_TRIV3|nr:hypothetical protein TVAGG3_1035850 [Trichomonas vaginalis G3]EAY19411.1 hypothetical protein TVAG_101290 [Trichomonas vaginalis G3]KAI5493191.1 hypothetical protein TVAGG3_1035850 [Trichomonas vaginalis G3]|eukprot:XP_001580397.1 hypothetical protein [Trichomonas vaginalis G3]